MNSCDFSSAYYSFDDVVNDTNVTHDQATIIPLLRAAPAAQARALPLAMEPAGVPNAHGTQSTFTRPGCSTFPSLARRTRRGGSRRRTGRSSLRRESARPTRKPTLWRTSLDPADHPEVKIMLHLPGRSLRPRRLVPRPALQRPRHPRQSRQPPVVGWVDWNLLLDHNGGPNHLANTCDAPLVLTPDETSFVVQPMYYFLSHVSRSIPPGSKRIAAHVTYDALLAD
ncbi:hypothetical protein SPRG_17702 [Saprolegnia parasitica CBS 223.65]|uniref:Glycosyl hydrolase family 30 TIM-barrel domain-containing protein n=1 Tax=Saprolegnia parasitica (strain CBS 223.65) TaxID=695850 RepID=A0A067BFB6_SAPPC|nr:hypothetical protein SPRG_17702 [Saprolegnia parasitica CBS 223.65]KDO16813.1 hypothetical protein SPRG_17702 [Saprolegnia parasitica CBS 223.65]|eukprot:XP_012212479.1 hypothetical protein SPRG_17702 [Saprolegnia parasitica CBS 223.65]